ncbi:tetratricopeptide repeat protein [Polystyrenella longa]|uniref:tetratricopeptide repeat protein n=1 Tax=Polystyrenella longa TaxID=2528007 RepID=UPI0011A035AF|nr:hypothetical protein [Polystyrenella longa]
MVHHHNNCTVKPNGSFEIPAKSTYIFDKDKDSSLPVLNLFSFEDVDLNIAAKMTLPETVYVLVRSPQNMLASRLVRCRRFPDTNHEYGCFVNERVIAMQKQYMKEVLNGGMIIPQAKHLIYDHLISETPSYVAHSCFGSSEKDDWSLDKSKLTGRWSQFVGDPEFMSCFDSEMKELSKQLGFPLEFQVDSEAVYDRKINDSKFQWSELANSNEFYSIEKLFAVWFTQRDVARLSKEFRKSPYDWLTASVLSSLMILEGKYHQALRMALKALELRRNNRNINLLMRVLGKLPVEKAVEVIENEFQNDDVYFQLMARVAVWERDHGKAERLLKEAVKLTDSPISHDFLGRVLMCQGKWKEGCREYSYRLQTDRRTARTINYLGKIWNGEECLNGKRVLIYFEQGSGDGFMGCRFVQPLLDKYPDAHLILNMDDSMIPLFPDYECVSKRDMASGLEIEYDYCIPLLSLPAVLDIEMTGQPYLTYPEVNDEGVGKIGLCWKGNPDNQHDAERSIPLSVFTSMDVPWISLQYGYSGSEIEKTKIENFGDTAALINSVSCVVTCDTAVAHLSGSMGKDTYLCLPYRGEWRWGLREDCDLYDSVSIIRCGSVDDWSSIKTHLEQQLKKQKTGHLMDK